MILAPFPHRLSLPLNQSIHLLPWASRDAGKIKLFIATCGTCEALQYVQEKKKHKHPVHSVIEAIVNSSSDSPLYFKSYKLYILLMILSVNIRARCCYWSILKLHVMFWLFSSCYILKHILFYVNIASKQLILAVKGQANGYKMTRFSLGCQDLYTVHPVRINALRPGSAVSTGHETAQTFFVFYHCDWKHLITLQ